MLLLKKKNNNGFKLQFFLTFHWSKWGGGLLRRSVVYFHHSKGTRIHIFLGIWETVSLNKKNQEFATSRSGGNGWWLVAALQWKKRTAF